MLRPATSVSILRENLSAIARALTPIEPVDPRRIKQDPVEGQA